MKTADTVALIVRDKIEELGFELYDIEFEREYGEMNLVIYIDRPSGVDIDDCERVSRAVDPLIDAADPIKEAYCLCVSSVGIDRPLKKDRDYARSMGSIIEIKLYAAMDKQKELKGKLVGFDADSFTIERENGEQTTVLRKNAALVRPYIDFK